MTLDARVYIDETAHINSNIFGLVAVFIPQGVHHELEHRWQDLQQRILLEIQNSPHGYDLAKAYFQKHPNQLPEIHAATLINPSSARYSLEHPKRDLIYRKYPRGQEGLDNAYWKTHVAWLDAAFQIQDQFRLPILLMGGAYDFHNPQMTGSPTLTSIFRHWDAPESSSPDFQEALLKMDQLQAQPITWAVPQMLFTIQKELKRRNWTAEIVFDASPDNLGFRTSTLFKYLQEKRHLPNIKELLFQESHLEPLLQIADIHAYVFEYQERLAHENKVLTERDQAILWMARYYLQRQLQHSSIPEITQDERIWGKLLAFEYIIKNSGKVALQDKALFWFINHYERITGIFSSSENGQGLGRNALAPDIENDSA
jgi:hypothetical protein